jgi:hypothetical protein
MGVRWFQPGVVTRNEQLLGPTRSRCRQGSAAPCGAAGGLSICVERERGRGVEHRRLLKPSPQTGLAGQTDFVKQAYPTRCSSVRAQHRPCRFGLMHTATVGVANCNLRASSDAVGRTIIVFHARPGIWSVLSGLNWPG